MALGRRQVLLGGLGLAPTAGLAGRAGLTSKKGGEAPAQSSGPVTETFVNWSSDTEMKAFEV